ncbi:MAG: Arginine--tRNA ligase [Elusimicrobia bacterium]|nr:Arginine--tRNA ligase [Elusimicrobiota bacterium]
MILIELKKLISSCAMDVLTSQGKEADLPEFDLTNPPPRVPGDLATNVALALAKRVGTSPRSLAEQMIKSFPQTDWIQKIDIAGAGFLNFWLTDQAFQSELQDFLKGQYGPITNDRQKILLEFVSANPTGPLHVGHGRGAALGDSLVRILRYLGHEVNAEFYINDAGGQIRNLGLSVEARIKEIQGETVSFPEEGYRGEYVIDIAKQALTEGKKFNPVQPAQMIFDETDAAGYASAINLKIIQKTLADFGVKFDQWFSESSLHKKNAVLKLIQELRDKNLAYDQEGATWFRATQFGDEKDRVLQKANEAPTYFASDLAYHADKLSRGFSKLINIWGADHHGYAQRLKGALQAIGLDASKLEVVFNQMISIKGARMSKRAGNVVTLQEVVDEVGCDATRFFFALRSPGAHFEFDLDLAKKQASDNPVYYVQYLHARCCSIFREAEKRGWTFARETGQPPLLKEPLTDIEKETLIFLASFDRTVETCARDLSNHHLTGYLQELAGKFHSFYEKCRVLEEDPTVRNFRLGLVDAIRRRVAQGLNLLGVSAPQTL